MTEPAVQAPAAPATPEAPMPGFEGGDDGEGALIQEALKELREAPEEQPEPEDDPKPEESKPEEPKPTSLEERKAQLTKALEGLSREERDQLLGTTDDAFAALTAKYRRNREEREEIRELKAAMEREKSEQTAVREEFDQALSKGRQDPLFALELFGWTLEQAHEFAASGKQIPIDKRINEIETAAEKRAREAEERYQKLIEAREQEETRAQIEGWHSAVWNDVQGLKEDAHPLAARWDKREVFEAVVGLQSKVVKDLNSARQLAQAGFRLRRLPNGMPFLETSEALRYVEMRLQKQREAYLAAGGTPSGPGPNETAKPEAGTEPKHLSSKDASERGLALDDDEDVDERELTRRALAVLQGGG